MMGKAIFATGAGVFLGGSLVYAAYVHGPSAIAYVLGFFSTVTGG